MKILRKNDRIFADTDVDETIVLIEDSGQPDGTIYLIGRFSGEFVGNDIEITEEMINDVVHTLNESGLESMLAITTHLDVANVIYNALSDSYQYL